MKFSIIITTYNSVKSLPKTLDSILTQAYFDYEVIVIDNASTDGTVSLLEKYKPKFRGNIRWVSEPDKGIYDAMNKGIDLAKGDWLYFLGSGDSFYDEYVLDFIKDITEHEELDVVYGNVELSETKKIVHGKFSNSKLISQNFCHQAIFCRREIFKRTGKFNLGYKISADYIFNIEWFTDKKIRRKYVPKIIAVFDTSGFSSEGHDKKFLEQRKEIFRKNFSTFDIFLGQMRVLLHKIVVALGLVFKGDFTGLRNKIVRAREKKNS